MRVAFNCLERLFKVAEQRRDLGGIEHGGIDEKGRGLARLQRGVGLDEQFNLLPRQHGRLGNGSRRATARRLRRQALGLHPHGNASTFRPT